MRHKILLATKSPLYAPIIHAWVTADEAFRREYPLAYAQESTEEDDDDLVDGTLKEFNSDRVLLAVGDLTRLYRYWLDPENYFPPIILNGFIDRMCLWLLDGRKFTPALPAADDLHGGPIIMCHPKHMTTYYVANWYAQKLAQWDDDSVNRRIRPIIRPGWERQFYHEWNLKSRGSFRIAYMSTQLPSDDTRACVAVKFSEKFNPISMTGIFTSEPIAETRAAIIREFCDRIRRSIAVLYTEGDQLAWDLYENRAKLEPIGAAHSYTDWYTTSHHLARIDGYSTNLALTESQLREMVDLRALSDRSEADVLFNRLSETLPSGFSVELPPEPAEDMLAVVLHTRQQLRAEFARRQEREIHITAGSMMWKIFRLAYLSASLVIGMKALAIMIASPTGLDWHPLEAFFIFTVFLGIAGVDGVHFARTFERVSIVDILVLLASAYICSVTLVQIWMPTWLTEGLVTAAIVAGSVFYGWIRATKWRPGNKSFRARMAKRSRIKEARRLYSIVLHQFSRSHA